MAWLSGVKFSGPGLSGARVIWGQGLDGARGYLGVRVRYRGKNDFHPH